MRNVTGLKAEDTTTSFIQGGYPIYQITSLPIAVNPNRGFNCFFPMPFTHAKIVLRNDHNEDVLAFFYQIDYTEYDSLPPDVLRFHAQWRRSPYTSKGKDYVP